MRVDGRENMLAQLLDIRRGLHAHLIPLSVTLVAQIDRGRSRIFATLQHAPTALVAGLSATRTRSHNLASLTTDGANAPAKLTFQLDHSVGAGHDEERMRPMLGWAWSLGWISP